MSGTITLRSRQRRMMDWVDTKLSYRFIGIGKTTAWEDENNPPVPEETMTEVTELVGLQRVDSYKFAKVIPNPTTLQKRTSVYYKGLYYAVTQDSDVALNEGYTSIMVQVTLDRDTIDAIPVGITFRQVGLYVGVNATPSEIQYGITKQAWDNKSIEDKGMLEVIDNRPPIGRLADQQEQILICIDF